MCPGCSVKDPGFSISDLAKGDVDMVADIHIGQIRSLLETLTVKLYKMNSDELQKSPGATVDSRIASIFQCPPLQNFSELSNKQGTQAILLGFEPEFTGDRVFAVMYGLYTMIMSSYSEKCSLYMIDFLDQQNLYNSARNIEIFVWRINNRYRADGQLFLATNQCDGPVKNLSFERIFGKLISLQDTMALVVSNRTGRLITKVVHTAASMTFFPIGL